MRNSGMAADTDVLIIVWAPNAAAALAESVKRRGFRPTIIECRPGTLDTEVQSGLSTKLPVIVIWNINDQENRAEFWALDYRTGPQQKLLAISYSPSDNTVDIMEFGEPLVHLKGAHWTNRVAAILQRGPRRSIAPKRRLILADNDPFLEDLSASIDIDKLAPTAAPAPMLEAGDPFDALVAVEPAPQPEHGSILWTMPDHMRVGRRERVEIRLGDARVAEAQLREGLKGRGVPQIDHLAVSCLMRVTLIGDPKDFFLLPLSTMDQYLRIAEAARWDFDVTPLRAGHRILRVLVVMRFTADGKEQMRDLPSYEREVRVSVAPLHTAGTFVAKNWQWLTATLAIPFVAWLATRPAPLVWLLHQVGIGL
jgi:hypothetical protein